MTIPRILMQFWHTEPPADVAALMRTWRTRSPEFEYRLFDAASAEAYLAEHHDAAVLRAFRSAALPAMASDIFRVAFCLREGGVYVDAASECVSSVAPMLSDDVDLVVVRKWHGGLMNGFLAARPGAPPLRAILDRILHNVDARVSSNVWEVTGPGVFRKVLDDADPRIRIVEQKHMTRYFRLVNDLAHKRDAHWSKQQKDTSIYRDPEGER